MLFRARQFEFVFPRPALVMGVVNVTPDSFSDGGKFLDTDAAVGHALKLAAQGAEILDIGGESTRPNAEPVEEKEELRRVIPVIEQLSENLKSGRDALPRVPADRQVSPTQPPLISIDTRKPAVAHAALAAGASIVNDVGANREEVAMWREVAECGAGYVCMHAPGTPQTLHEQPAYTDIVREIGGFFQERLKRLNAAGVTADQVVLDVGIGFGKTVEHNLQLLANLRSFTTMARPLLIGVSRKSFIGRLLGADVKERLPGSLACAVWAVASGAQVIRAHDVMETVQVVRMAEAITAARRERW
jgi:dihydropteroate synthase